MKKIMTMGLMAALLLSVTGIAFAQDADSAVLAKIQAVAMNPRSANELMSVCMPIIEQAGLQEQFDEQLTVIEKQAGAMGMKINPKAVPVVAAATVSPEALSALSAKCDELIKENPRLQAQVDKLMKEMQAQR